MISYVDTGLPVQVRDQVLAESNAVAEVPMVRLRVRQVPIVYLVDTHTMRFGLDRVIGMFSIAADAL